LNEKDSNMQNIKEKVVVIAGASSGLGEATARLLAAEGEALWWVRSERWIGSGLGHSNEFVEARGSPPSLGFAPAGS
jgi:NAD(P)-dependent dehydrogenase (short-subunit alcohol dehydrogenase family)